MRIAIIGAGLAGLVATEKLVASGHSLDDIDVYEKSRGPGGRLSTRYHENFVFDHGAPFFTAREKGFRDWLADKIRSGLIAEWTPDVVSLEIGKKPFKRPWFEPHYVSNVQMNHLGKALAKPFQRQINYQKKVVSLYRGSELSGSKPGDLHNKWFLVLEESRPSSVQASDPVIVKQQGPYDLVMMAIPGPQANALLANSSHERFERSSVESRAPSLKRFNDPDFFGRHDVVVDSMAAEYALMLGFNELELEKLGIHWNLAKVSNSPISWISVENSKPGRLNLGPSSKDAGQYSSTSSSSSKSLVVRSSPRWSMAHLEHSQNDVTSVLLSELSELVNFDIPKPDFTRLHRWMYAQSTDAHLDSKKAVLANSANSQIKDRARASVYDAELGLGACGDWLLSGNVESAFVSASDLVDQVVSGY